MNRNGTVAVIAAVGALGLLGLVAGGVASSSGGRSRVDQARQAVEAMLARALAGNVSLPLPGQVNRVSQPFGYPSAYGPHPGTDLVAAEGTEVYAIEGGVVVRIDYAGVGSGKNNGNCVVVRGNSGLMWYYLHFSNFGPGIGPGVPVGRHQLIGFSGHTGLATGPHLHVQVEWHGEKLDLVGLLPSGAFV